MFILNQFEGVLLDLDGVIYRGNELLPYVPEFFDWLESHSIEYVLITNNSTRPPEQIAKKLDLLGITVLADRIITSAVATAQYIQEHVKHRPRIFAIGEEGLHEALLNCDFELTDNQPEFVVMGLARNFQMSQIEIAVKAIRDGAIFIATNMDPTLATERGLEPGTGALISMVASEVDCQPIVIGKPEPWLFDTATKKLKKSPSDLVMIGDNLETDIRGAQDFGLSTILVLTGIATKSSLAESDIKPDFVIDNFGYLWT